MDGCDPKKELNYFAVDDDVQSALLHPFDVLVDVNAVKKNEQQKEE